MNILTSRQVGKLLTLGILSLKLVTFPSLYVQRAGADAYIVVFLSMLLNLIVFSVLFYIAKKNPNKTFDELLSAKFGQLATDIIYFLIFVYFLIKGMFLIKESNNYLLETLFTHLSTQMFIIPLLVFLGFMISRSLRSIGRSIEVMYPLVIIGLVLTMLIPIKTADFSNILPFMENGTRPIFETLVKNNFSGGDFMAFIILMGRYKIEKDSTKIFYKAIIKAMIMVIVFYIVYIAIFARLAQNQTIAISDMPQHSSFPYNVGRVDWITINLWTITLIFQTGVLLSFSLFAFNKVFKVKNKNASIVFLLLFIYASSYLVFLSLERSIAIVTHPIFITLNIVFKFSVPLLILIGSIRPRKERHEFNKKVLSE